MKPNFSLLARELQVDRKTVKKYYNGFTNSTIKANKSKIDSLGPITLLNIERLLTAFTHKSYKKSLPTLSSTT